MNTLNDGTKVIFTGEIGDIYVPKDAKHAYEVIGVPGQYEFNAAIAEAALKFVNKKKGFGEFKRIVRLNSA